MRNKIDKINLSLKGNDLDEIELEMPEEAAVTNIMFSLGYSTCHVSYNWNKSILKGIDDRDGVDFLGRSKFIGTEEEKNNLNNNDKSKLIKVESDYFENFVVNFLQSNNTIKDNDRLNDNRILRIGLNFNNITDFVNNFNNKFRKFFKILNVEEIDQLFFATIELKEANLIDVFAFGFELCLADEVINEKNKI